MIGVCGLLYTAPLAAGVGRQGGGAWGIPIQIYLFLLAIRRNLKPGSN